MTVAAAAGWAAPAFVLSVFFSLNLVLFILNILPVPPLDGSGVLPWLLGPKRGAFYQQVFHQPMMSLVGILVAWRVFAMIFWPLFFYVVGLLYPGLSYQR